MTAITIREVGLRDGLQALPETMPTAAKCDWISREAACGIRSFEAASFVSPKALPQMADAADVCRHAATVPDIERAVLVPNARGAERAIAAGVDTINFVISVSEAHNLNNVRRTVAESTAEFGRVAAVLREVASPRPKLAAGLATSFGCTFAGRVDPLEVRRLAAALLALGAEALLVADTVGYADPTAIRTLVTALRADCGPDVPIALHLHDTRGLALANSLVAYDCGIRHFDAALGGLGGCPFAPGASGNVATEDLVFMFESMGVPTGVDLDALLTLRERVTAELPAAPFAGSIARAGLPKGWVHAAH